MKKINKYKRIILALAMVFTMALSGCSNAEPEQAGWNDKDNIIDVSSVKDSADYSEFEQSSKDEKSKASSKEETRPSAKESVSGHTEYTESDSATSSGQDYVAEDNSGSISDSGSGSVSGSGSGSGSEGAAPGSPVPEGKPSPIAPDDVVVDTTTEKTCYLSISCYTILNNMGDLTPGKEVLVPSDGVIYATREVTFYDGETVFDVLLRETQNNAIHMEYEFTPGYDSNYIEGIANLYEKDCGSGSGWMYSVNGWYPNYGCSSYQVQDKDVIQWNYTCDLGRDL